MLVKVIIHLVYYNNLLTGFHLLLSSNNPVSCRLQPYCFKMQILSYHSELEILKSVPSTFRIKNNLLLAICNDCSLPGSLSLSLSLSLSPLATLLQVSLNYTVYMDNCTPKFSSSTHM